ASPAIDGCPDHLSINAYSVCVAGGESRTVWSSRRPPWYARLAQHPPEPATMTTPRQIEANRLNALKSTGPKTILGKAKAARNAIRRGLSALPAVVPELGESVETWFTFAARVVRSFDPDGVTQRQLAYRAAQLIWRLDRVGRSDAAVIAAVVAAALPPDPATVAPEKSSHPFHPPGPLPPDAPAH